MFRALLIAALKPEWTFLKRKHRFEKLPFSYPLYRIADRPSAALLQTGPGLERGHEAFSRFLDEFGCERALQFGTCGALNSELATGDISAAYAVLGVNDDGTPTEPVPCDMSTQNRLLHVLTRDKIPFHQGTLVSVAVPAKNKDEKKRLGQTTKAKSVDMESYPVAKLCREKGIPYNALRGVFDALNEDIAAMGEPYNEQGGISPFKLAANLIKTPKIISSLPELKRRVDLIGKRLEPAVELFLA
jgi:nucleoside phosphorylase